VPRPVVLAALAASIGVALFHCVLIADAHPAARRVMPGAAVSFLVMLGWSSWAAALPLFQRLVQRVPLAPRPRPWAIGVHVVAAFVASALHMGLAVLVAGLLDRGEPVTGVTVWLNRVAADRLLTIWLNRLEHDLVVYAAIVAALAAREASRRSVAEATRSAELEERLSRAQLEVLSLQLQPHFLFNTLNAVAGLAHEDREEARRMLRDLRGLLALSFERAARPEVTLREELDFVRAYAAIQSRRFRGLRFEEHAEPETLSARVPQLLLQPLVENAIRHGLAHRRGRVEVRAWREGDELRIDVVDDGAGLPRDGQGRDGLGIRNTQARLAHLHGTAQRLELEARPGGGVRARVALPFRMEEAA
jgi:anti-sigma regulatory factor (Ser/Thr protein kinase)